MARSGGNRRSMVAGDTASKDTAISSAISSSPNRRSVGTSSSMIGSSRFPVGAPSTAQQNANASMTSGPYSDARGALGRTIHGTRASRSDFRALLRCQPVVAHNSSSIRRPFAAFPERLYLVAIATDTACFCANVSPITRA